MINYYIHLHEYGMYRIQYNNMFLNFQHFPNLCIIINCLNKSLIHHNLLLFITKGSYEPFIHITSNGSVLLGQ